MGTTAEKLTYLNETKSKIKDNINLTGAGLTNQTPFRQYATDLKTALLNILNNGIDSLYNNFPKTTGRGANITLNNTLQAPIRSVINGDTEQDGEPTPDNPQEIKSVTGLQKITISGGTGTTPQEYEINLGKNLFDISTITENKYVDGSTGNLENSSSSNASDYISVKENETYTISYNYSSLQNTGNRAIVFYNSNKTYISYTTYITPNKTNSFTIPNGTEYIRMTLDKNCIDIQLEQGSQASSFSPYFTPIHLYEGDQIIGTPYNWSIIHNKVENIIDGTSYIAYESETSTPTQRTVFRVDITNNATTSQYLSNRFIQGSTTSNRLVMSGYSPYISLDNTITGINTSDTNTEKINKLKTWLSTNNVSIVFALGTPTTEAITNTELIEDLNNFYNAKSYNGQTNISVQGDLQMILDVSAIIGDE